MDKRKMTELQAMQKELDAAELDTEEAKENSRKFVNYRDCRPETIQRKALEKAAKNETELKGQAT